MNTRSLVLGMSVLSIIFFISFFCFSQTADAQYSRRWRNMNADNGNSEEQYNDWRVDSSLRRKIDALDDDAVDELPIPILLGIKLSQIPDSWGDARSNGRTHEGVDILAPRGAFVVSPTDAVVTRIGEGGNGGIYVYTANPGNETFYFAHLDSVNEDLDEGDVLEPGDLIGYVGNTGNASAGPTHLHLGIYDDDHDASNPYPRLEREFTLEERMEAIEKILDNADDEDELAESLVSTYRSLFVQAQADDIDLPKSIEDELEKPFVAPAVSTSSTLRIGSRGSEVVWLQQSLIKEDVGSKAEALKKSGADGSFGPITLAAVIEYQKDNNLTADGVVGPRTRAELKKDGY